MNKWECIQVDHHNDIGETIEEYQRKGWALHTYLKRVRNAARTLIPCSINNRADEENSRTLIGRKEV